MRYDAGGDLEPHVKVPSVLAARDTGLYLYYGNAPRPKPTTATPGTAASASCCTSSTARRRQLLHYVQLVRRLSWYIRGPGSRLQYDIEGDVPAGSWGYVVGTYEGWRLQGALGGGDLFGLFHQGGVAGERAPAVRYADPAIFNHAPRYHGGGFAGSGLLPDEVPIIARRGELVVPPERVVREEKSPRERPITVVVNVTAADANSFRAIQGQIAAEMARAIDRATRNR